MKKLFFTLALIVSLTCMSQNPLMEIPFEKYGDHIFIKVSVDDSEPLDFIFDTGDGLTVLDLDIAKKLNLDLDSRQTTTSAGGRITGSLIKHNKLEINDLLIEGNIKVYATSLDHLEISIGKNVDGIVGYDLLVHHTVRVDYDDMTFKIYDKGEGPKNGEAIRFKLHNAIPTIEASVTLNNGEVLSGSFFVNTGAGTTMDFNTPFADANNIIDKTGEHYSYLVKGLEEQESVHYEGKVEKFFFGGQEFENLPIGISQATFGIQNDKKIAGIIGNRLLEKFNLTLDYANNTLYFERNNNFDEMVTVNASGIDVQLSKDKESVLIHQVYEDSPAREAGISVNDILISINGKDAMEMGLAEVERLLLSKGEEVTLVIERNGTEKSFTIILRELI